MRVLHIWQGDKSLQSASNRSHECERPFDGTRSLASLLQLCIDKKDFSLGEYAYSVYIRNGLQSHTYLGCLLIRMFALCGNLHKASQVFFSMQGNNIYTWTAIILAHVQFCQCEKAIVYYEHMLWSSVKENSCTFVVVLKACEQARNIKQGMVIHTKIAGQQCDGSLFVQSALIGMYMNCGRIHDAHNSFNGLPVRDQASWSVMIKGYVMHNQSSEAFKLAEQMQQQGIEPNKATLLVLLKALTSKSSMAEKEEFYSAIVKLGLEADTHIGSSLLNMYAKLGKVEEALHIFHGLSQERDVVSWNVMIASMVECGHNVDVSQLLEKMRCERVNPSGATYVSLLKNATDLGKVRYLHADILRLGLELHLQVGSSLVNLYVKYLCILDARSIFDRLHGGNVVLWCSMMAGYVEQGPAKQVFELYDTMLHKGMTPDGYAYSCLLQATDTLSLGYLVHINIAESSFESDLFVGNVLIDTYASHGNLECAQAVFDRLPNRNSVSFSTMITLYVDYGYGDKALQLFSESWLENVELDRVMLLCILSSCTSTFALIDGTLVYGSIVELGLEGDSSIGTALIDLYARCGSFEDAERVCYALPVRNVVAYSSLMAAYAEHGHLEIALQLSERMQEVGLLPDAITWLCVLQACSGLKLLRQGKQIHANVVKLGYELNVLLGGALVTMYSKCGKLEDSERTFDGLRPQDVALWSALIAGHVDNGDTEGALTIFGKMQREGAKPNAATFLCVLEACSTLANLHFGFLLHFEIKRQGLQVDLMVGNALIDMYCKCGSVNHAFTVFKELKERNLVSWYTIMAGLADHGLFELIDRCLDSMQEAGMLLDAGIFVSLLSVCSHAGWLIEGLHIFDAIMKYRTFILMAEHCVCLVDVLGRAGCVEAAEKVTLNMPYPPTSVAWITLLGACVKHGNVDIAEQTFRLLNESKCNDVVPGYVLMHNIYATSCSEARSFLEDDQ